MLSGLPAEQRAWSLVGLDLQCETGKAKTVGKNGRPKQARKSVVVFNFLHQYGQPEIPTLLAATFLGDSSWDIHTFGCCRDRSVQLYNIRKLQRAHANAIYWYIWRAQRIYTTPADS